jgi:hypothetical protein
MTIRIARGLSSVALLCSTHPAIAQDLAPRAYLITPAGTNAIVLAYSHLNGNIDFDGAVPITDATANVSLPILSYYRTLDLFGRTANLTLVVPYGFGEFHGTVSEVPRNAQRSGFLDSLVRFSVNLIGGPAMEPADFAKWRQTVLLGVSLTISAPSGQYDPTKLLNFGSNRFSFKPEIGYSQRLGNWVFDGTEGQPFLREIPISSGRPGPIRSTGRRV